MPRDREREESEATVSPVKRLGVVMVRCPKTGRELSTGIEMDAATLEQLPDIRSMIECPVCRVEHVWSTREAWLDNPPPDTPALPWLFFNNRSAAND
jgi:hypothetical protein